jgi:hypothetical protein
MFLLFSDTESPSIPGLSFGGGANNWRMFSIPHILQNNSIASIFEPVFGAYDNTKWRLVHYQNDNSLFVDYTEGLSSIERGKGYWFNAVESNTISIGAATTPIADFNMSLQAGWNQIGNPFPFSISWDEVLSINNSTGVEGLRATSNGTSLSDVSTLSAFGGAYVFADAATSLNIPLSIIGNARKKTQDPNMIWEINFDLETSGYTNEISGLGMHKEASLSKDRYDHIRLPRFIHYSDISFEHPEFFAPYFAKDVVPESEEFEWEFTVQSNLVGESSSLKWAIPELPYGKQLVLYDVTNESIIDMTDLNFYTFSTGEETKFRVLYGGDKYLNQNLNAIILSQSFPNPFENKTVIPFTITGDNGIYNVTLEIYDLMGRKVITLVDSELNAGTYSAQ